jgi:hydrogenase maturation protease
MPDANGYPLKTFTGLHSVVVCAGNTSAGDDAAGWAVYKQLQFSSEVLDAETHFVGVAGLQMLDCLKGQKLLVVVDAVRFGASPGTVHVLPWQQLPKETELAISSHSLGLREAMELGLLLQPETMPEEAFLVGIEGTCFGELGVGLTPAVSQAVEKALVEVRKLIGKSRN